MKTDNELCDDILDGIAFNPEISDSEKIAVSVYDEIATLGGVVTTYAEKLAIERIVKSIRGLKGIANEIKIEAWPKYERDDVALARAAVSALVWNVNVPSDDIKVIVENGCVRLSGKVKWHYQREDAEVCIRNLYGIKAITNQIEIEQDFMPVDVKNKIIEEFKRNALIDAEQIKIDVEGNTVKLSGNVRNWFEMQQAVDSAWGVAGVLRVVNQLNL